MTRTGIFTAKVRDLGGGQYVLPLTVADYADVQHSVPSAANRQRRVEHLEGLSIELDPAWSDGLTTMADAAKLLDTGWPEGAQRALSLQGELQGELPAPVNRRRVRRWRDTGDELDYDRILTGRPEEAWKRMERSATGLGAGVTIEIVTTFGANSDKSSAQILWNGASCLALADLLENAGYSVGLTGVFVARCYGRYGRYGRDIDYIIAIELKRPGDPLDVNALAAAICHGGIFRVLGICAIELAPFDVGSGHGHHDSTARVVPRLVEEQVLPPVQIILPERIYSKQAAVEALRKAVADVNAANYAALDV